MAVSPARGPDTLDAGAGARARTPRPRSRADRAVVTPLAAACETEADQLIARELSKMLPNQNHPLTRAYMLGARSTTTAAYAEALHLIRACEGAADQLTIDQCKLAAEVMIERKMP